MPFWLAGARSAITFKTELDPFMKVVIWHCACDIGGLSSTNYEPFHLEIQRRDGLWDWNTNEPILFTYTFTLIYSVPHSCVWLHSTFHQTNSLPCFLFLMPSIAVTPKKDIQWSFTQSAYTPLLTVLSQAGTENCLWSMEATFLFCHACSLPQQKFQLKIFRYPLAGFKWLRSWSRAKDLFRVVNRAACTLGGLVLLAQEVCFNPISKTYSYLHIGLLGLRVQELRDVWRILMELTRICTWLVEWQQGLVLQRTVCGASTKGRILILYNCAQNCC